jgi:choline dehydrogenase-like flavoprotein
MKRIDGREVRASLERSVDVVVVGSGPAGSAVARAVAAAGASVIVVEEGAWADPEAFPESSFRSMATHYREMSASMSVGTSPLPYIQGRMVGGSSPINGAICWRPDRHIWDEWVAADRALEAALPWDEIEATTDEIEARLNVAPTDPSIAGPKNLLLARGAEAIGLAHRPIRRNVRGCEGLGRCMQGCPKGRKESVDGTLLADAERDGAEVWSSVEVTSIETHDRSATGVVGRAAGGGTVRVRAKRIVVAASAVQSPALLIRSGITQGPVGHNFQAHPGVSMAGHFPEPVYPWNGATQGHEVIGLRHEGLKFEALGFGLAIMAARVPGGGSEWARHVAEMHHDLDWGAAVKAEARGRVRCIAGRTVVTYAPTQRDVARFRRGLRILGEMMLAAGADYVMPGVRGLPPATSSLDDLIELEENGPRRASAFTAVMTHLFGTCRMGADPRTSVVRPDFRHHAIDRLYVVDSSVFPTNTGVNPQIAIMTLATLGARRVLASLDAKEPLQ